jgi:hypothetical protein
MTSTATAPGTATDGIYKLEDYEREFIAMTRETLTAETDPAYWFGRAAASLAYLPHIIDRAAAATGIQVSEATGVEVSEGRQLAGCRSARELTAWLKVKGYSSGLTEGEWQQSNLVWAAGLGTARAFLRDLLFILGHMSD